MMADKGKKIKTSEKQYGWCEAEEGWLPMIECSGCIHHFFDDTSHTSYCRWEKPVSWIPEAELPNDIAKLREELRAALTESVRPIQSQVCAWCEKDEMYVPMQDCMGCSHNRQDGMTIWCSWMPEMKPCEGCGIPAEYCEPETCLIAQAKEKAADVVETAEEYILITF